MNKRRERKTIKLFWGVIITLVAIIIALSHFRNSHYQLGTMIAGVNCSGLTVEKAEEKINSYYAEKLIFFNLPDNIFAIDAKDINWHLSNSSDLKEILNQQKNGVKEKNYELNSFTFDNLNSVLTDMSSSAYISEPQNAYLELSDSNFLEIVPEKNGQIIDVDKIYNIAATNLKCGKTAIDFSKSVITKKPEICATDLKTKKDEINKILSTVINFQLKDGSIITLDNNIMKNWLVKDKNGSYFVDIENNLPNFITTLSERISEFSLTSTEFNATDIGSVTIQIPPQSQTSLNSKKELKQLESDLKTGKTINRSPIYSKDISFKSYVEIDVSRQTVWMYHNGDLIVKADCVTGTAGKYDTPSGLFFLTYKVEDDYLEGYNADGTKYKSFVHYWMPFNGNIGLHDASWRHGKFGETIYKNNGSHGCINLPFDAAKKIYENINGSMPIIVYESGNSI